MAEPNSTSDPTTTDAVSLTRVVESEVADTIAHRGRGGGSSWEREMDALPFVGEMSRDCKTCKGFGVVALSPDMQELWKRKLADVRLQLAEVPGGKEGDEDRKRCGEALRRELENYQNKCRCPRCDGYGRTVAPGTRVVREGCDRCGGSGKTGGKTCQKCQGRRVASLGIPDSCWNTISCWRCRGSGEVLDEDAQDVCPVCAGEKCTLPITVRSTGCSKKGRLPPGYEPADDVDHGSSAGSVSVPDDFQDDADAAEPEGEDDAEDRLLDARLSVALGLLEVMRETDPTSLAVLEAYYGPDGDHYAKADRWGRGHALWPLTAGGKALLAVIREHGGTSRPLAALAAMRAAEAETGVKNIAWQSHMRAAVAESREILERARKALSGVA
jgi:hypothetical protein